MKNNKIFFISKIYRKLGLYTHKYFLNRTALRWFLVSLVSVIFLAVIFAVVYLYLQLNTISEQVKNINERINEISNTQESLNQKITDLQKNQSEKAQTPVVNDKSESISYKKFKGNEYTFDYPSTASINPSAEGSFVYNNTTYWVADWSGVHQDPLNQNKMSLKDYLNSKKGGLDNYTQITVSGGEGYMDKSQLSAWVTVNDKTYMINAHINNSILSTNLDDPVWNRFIKSLKIL